MQLDRNPALLLVSSVCEIVAVRSGLLPDSQMADSKYSKSYKGNCKANHLENKYCIGTQHSAYHAQPITVQKLWRKCSIKVQPQWKVYHLNSFRCHITLFLPYFKGLIFASLVFPHTEICKSQCSTCAHAYSFVPLMFHYHVCVDIWKICPNTLSSAVTIMLIPIKRSTDKCE